MASFQSITSLDPLPEPAKPATGDAPPRGRRVPGGPHSRFDASDTGTENYKHWANADGLSANSANSPDVRYKLRTRSRYERANNGYVKGLIKGRTADTVGCGPRLQLELPEKYNDADFQRTVPTGSPDYPSAEDLARAVDYRFCEWWEDTSQTDKLRVLADAEDTDGEAFALFTQNDSLAGVTLDTRVVECDRVTTPSLLPEPLQVDGIRIDAAGRPADYYVLRRHPGETLGWFGASGPLEYDVVPARQVVHLFEQDRPEQYRGVPILTPALPLYAILRRYTLASLGAAELAAMIAGVIENPNAPIGDEDQQAPEFEAMQAVPFARNSLLTLAGGQTAKAFQPAQPGPDFPTFRSQILTEAGRSAGEMRNTSTGSSAEYNYSSGRLDHLPRQRALRIRRERFERTYLDRVFRAWLAEALLVPDYLPAGLPPVSEWRWKWQWDAFESIDPVKDAEAQQIRKAIGLTTDADELAAAGKDWREHYRQLARERQMRVELGLPNYDETTPGTLPADRTGTTPADKNAPAGAGLGVADE